MNNFFTPVAPALAALSLFAAAPKADAASSYCYQTERNATVCILSVHQNRNNPTLKLVRWNANGGAVYQDEIYCNPAHRYNFKENMAGIACFLFN